MPIYLFLPEVDLLQIHVLQSSFYKSVFYKSSPIPIFLERAMWLSTNHWNTIQGWRNHLHTTKTFYYDDETLKFVSKQRTRNHWVIKHIKTRQPSQWYRQWYILTLWDAWKSTLSRGSDKRQINLPHPSGLLSHLHYSTVVFLPGGWSLR